jgi:alkylhydroperoxidase/carboxymuconolactone decarboxylase family protein YurZ
MSGSDHSMDRQAYAWMWPPAICAVGAIFWRECPGTIHTAMRWVCLPERVSTRVEGAAMQLMSEERVTGLDPVFGPMGIEAGKAIWSEKALSVREKAVLLITADLCVPELGLPFELHVGMALGQAKMSVEDLRELLRHIAPDAGFNIVAMGFERLARVAVELGKDPDSSASPMEPGGPVYDDATLAAVRKLDPAFARDIDRMRRELWSRPGLSRRERCFATFAVDVIGGTLGAPFEAHVRLCREAGLTTAECHAAIRALAEFSIPKAWQALVVFNSLWSNEHTNAERRPS